MMSGLFCHLPLRFQIEGNHHLTRAQLLSVFGEDVEQNVLTVSLANRRAGLERLPWVEHATVMRLLPNKLRVSVVERKPVAFVRQGRHIGLVDAHGVLLDMGDGDGAGEVFVSGGDGDQRGRSGLGEGGADEDLLAVCE